MMRSCRNFIILSSVILACSFSDTVYAGILNSVGSVLEDVGDAAKDKVSDVRESAGDLVSSGIDAASDAAGDVGENISSGLSDLHEKVNDSIIFVGGKLQGVSAAAGSAIENAAGAISEAGVAAANAPKGAGTTVINGVMVVGDTLQDQVDFILQYEVGETKVVEMTKKLYDVYLSHTVLVILDGASSETVQSFIRPVISGATALLPGIVSKVTDRLIVAASDVIVDCKEKMKEVDEGAGVIIHVDLSKLTDMIKLEDNIDPQIPEEEETEVNETGD